VTLLDAYALVALLADEPAAGEVEELLYTGGAGVAVVNLAEAIDVSARVHGIPAAELRASLEPLLGTAVAVVVQDESAAWRAAGLRRRYYDRRSCPLSLADCLLLASAGADDAVATADPAVCSVARCEGFSVVPLPDSTGARP
jgi:PIN domain nuclease of toxin-antitoxin system